LPSHKIGLFWNTTTLQNASVYLEYGSSDRDIGTNRTVVSVFTHDGTLGRNKKA